MLLADRGYDAAWIRDLAMKKGAWANILPKSNRSDPICFSPYRKEACPQIDAGNSDPPIKLPKSKSFDGGAQFKLTSLLQKQRARGAASSFQDWSCPIVLPL